ncbi:MAG TPA: radical SAM protein [Myxococcales bacterium]|nr:radical SAM protein [Myxococcales bacterium]
MQLSRFVVSYENVRPGEHVLYSVLDDRYIGIDDHTFKALDRWKQDPTPASADERQTQEVLLEDAFLVEDRGVDDRRLRAHLDKASDGVPGTLFVTLMPTLQCNLACNYCFQKDFPAFTKMTSHTEDATLEWVLRLIDERGLRNLHVHYFGGEPTTRKDFCLRTAEIFSSAMKARGGTFVWQMTTNGVLLDVPFAKKMEQYGEGVFKVTLDGDKESHDSGRVYRDGRGSFDAIYENVVSLAKSGIRVRIGGNFKPDQVDSYEKVLDRLTASGVAGLLEGVNFKPVVEQGTCTSCTSQTETQTLVQLNKSLERRKMVAPILNGETLEGLLGPCELHWKHTYTIDPEGRVYKCPAVAGMPDMEVTKVTSRDPEKIAPLLELRPWEQCGDCAYMPVCVGGCLGAKFISTGRRDEVFCNKNTFEVSFRETIKSRYLAEFPPSI